MSVMSDQSQNAAIGDIALTCLWANNALKALHWRKGHPMQEVAKREVSPKSGTTLSRGRWHIFSGSTPKGWGTMGHTRTVIQSRWDLAILRGSAEGLNRPALLARHCQVHRRSLYRRLKQLTQAGLIEPAPQPPLEGQKGVRWAVFRLTEQGERWQKSPPTVGSGGVEGGANPSALPDAPMSLSVAGIGIAVASTDAPSPFAFGAAGVGQTRL